MFWSLTEGILMKLCTGIIFLKLKLIYVCVSICQVQLFIFTTEKMSTFSMIYFHKKTIAVSAPVKFSKGKNDIVSLKISWISSI